MPAVTDASPAVGNVSEIHRALRTWFRRHCRVLPWRTSRRDPWATLLSEVMLQQTRVDVVAPRFVELLRRWPTPAAMAASSASEVLAAWSGLGYYGRARRLHAAATAIVERHGGVFPSDEAALRALPGVGEYTAGAVGSLALGLSLPLVDGNVARVFARLFKVEGDVTSGAPAKRVRELAADVAPRRGTGEWNEALMELGALVCIPGRPRCEACPLARRCVARAEGRENEIPAPRARKPVRKVRAVAALIEDGAGRTLLLRRPDGGQLSGTWELPGAEVAEGEDPREALSTALTGAFGGRWRIGPRRGVVQHSILDRRITVESYEATEDPSAPRGRKANLKQQEDRRWVTPSELPALPRSSLLAKVMKRPKRAEK